LQLAEKNSEDTFGADDVSPDRGELEEEEEDAEEADDDRLHGLARQLAVLVAHLRMRKEK
jgi:hypothetical protein